MMAEVVAVLVVLIGSVALATGAAFVVLSVLLNVMRRTAVRPLPGALGSSQNRPAGPQVQRVPRYPLANHDGAAPLVTERAA